MGDILSQNEIDDLIRALNSGDIDDGNVKTTTQEKKIKLHNFKTPSKFAKDHIKTLHIINDTYARLVTTFLSGYLRTPVQLEVFSVEELPYSEFNNSISDHVILGVADFLPLSGSIIMEMAPGIAYALVDRILGGRGEGMEKIRGFTEIELAIVERIIIQILNLMREPWQNVIDLRPRLEKLETNAQFAQIVSPNEIIALITLKARVSDVEGMINICIPHIVVESILHKLSTRLWFSRIEKELSPEMKANLQDKIEGTRIPVKAILGKTTITVGEILELQTGDVIQLDTCVNSDIPVHVGDILKFHGKPGVKKNKVAMKITSVVRKEED